MAIGVKSGVAICCLAGSVMQAAGQSNTSYVLDGSGDYSSSGSLTNISAAGQPGGIAVSDSGDMVNYAGFLNTFSLQPLLDTDGDGLANEVDADNDGDNLADLAEILGTGFDPATATDVNNPDSDADGSSDGDESVAGTDPTDLNALLSILSIDVTNGVVEVSYRARGGAAGGKTYIIHSHTSAVDVVANPVDTNVTPASGSAPWYVVTNLFSSAAFSNDLHRFFAVEVLP